MKQAKPCQRNWTQKVTDTEVDLWTEKQTDMQAKTTLKADRGGQGNVCAVIISVLCALTYKSLAKGQVFLLGATGQDQMRRKKSSCIADR